LPLVIAPLLFVDRRHSSADRPRVRRHTRRQPLAVSGPRPRRLRPTDVPARWR